MGAKFFEDNSGVIASEQADDTSYSNVQTDNTKLMQFLQSFVVDFFYEYVYHVLSKKNTLFELIQQIHIKEYANVLKS